MKDIKTFLIGFLTCACLFLIMGQTSNKNLGDIEVNSIRIVKDGELINLFNSTGIGIGGGGMNPKLVLDMNGITMRNENDKDVAFFGKSANNSGLLTLYSKNGDEGVHIATQDDGGGSITIMNKHNIKVGYLQANQNQDGAIFLLDKYGNSGWAASGKY